MSFREAHPGADAAKVMRGQLSEILQQPLWDVEPHRKLIRQSGLTAEPIAEFYAAEGEERFLAMPAHSDQSLFHVQLAEERMPVFSAFYIEDYALLHVPLGTRSVNNLLRFIARDVRSYGEIFHEIGSTFRKLHEAGFGLPYSEPHRSMLEAVGFAPDEHTPYGGKLYLVPPYNLNPHLTFDQTISALHMELGTSKKFTDTHIRQLLAEVQGGWHGDV